MTKPTRIAALYLAVVFVAGGLFGVVAHGLYTQKTARAANPKEFRERYVAKLQKDLSLTPEQVPQVTAILDETSDRFREIREKMSPELDAIRQQQRAQIMALLKPEQQEKYQKILDEWRRRREQERGRQGK
jgi:Spy/CpxP family protein refolding chaperone